MFPTKQAKSQRRD